MILFVFEGGKAEPLVFDSLAKIFLTGENVRVVTCEHDLPTLFSRLKKNDYDLFRSLPLNKESRIPDPIQMGVIVSILRPNVPNLPILSFNQLQN